MEYFAKIREDLLQRYNNLLTASRTIGYLPVQQPAVVQPCSTKSETSGSMNKYFCLKADDCVLDLCNDTIIEGDLDEKFIHNKSDVNIKLKTQKCVYNIPGLSSFFMSDICEFDLLMPHLVCRKYNLIVIDPPWENRSAIRGKKYQWISHNQLTSLPIQLISAPGGLIVVWVTNKTKLRDFVHDTLFPSWNVATVGEWHWIKVTTEGELVFDIDSLHKKPYEVLIIGEYRVGALSCVENEDIPPDAKKGKLTLYSEMSTPLPYNYAFLCVPTRVHSQKPYLGDLFAPYLPTNPWCLELFARNLHHGWTSWGNEVLKFQEMSS
eukprot:Em0011g503a